MKIMMFLEDCASFSDYLEDIGVHVYGIEKHNRIFNTPNTIWIFDIQIPDKETELMLTLKYRDKICG